MLHEDQQRVVERPGTEPSRELQRSFPILARYQRLHRASELFVQGVEFRIPRRPRLLDRCHCILLPQTPTHDG